MLWYRVDGLGNWFGLMLKGNSYGKVKEKVLG